MRQLCCYIPFSESQFWDWGFRVQLTARSDSRGLGKSDESLVMFLPKHNIHTTNTYKPIIIGSRLSTKHIYARTQPIKHVNINIIIIYLFDLHTTVINFAFTWYVTLRYVESINISSKTSRVFVLSFSPYH